MPTRRPPVGVTVTAARALALALPDALEGEHMGHPDFRVRNRIFATLSPDGRRMNMRTTAVNLDALARSDPDTYLKVWGGRWLGVELDRVTRVVLRALLAEARTLTAPKARVATGRTRRPAGKRR